MRFLIKLTSLVIIIMQSSQAMDSGFRGFWVDAFNSSFKNSTEVEDLVLGVQAANCNSVIVQVRKRGDAYFNSRFEPKAHGVEEEFDPLKALIARGHDTSKGLPIEIHAWLSVFPVWEGNGVPVQTNHPYLLHKDWLTQDRNGERFDGKGFSFDPGHPEVQLHIFNVAMDVVSNYDVDGLNLDYMRYQDRHFGYNSNAVYRFNQRHKRTGLPSINDPLWSEFRREQISGLLRKIYLCAIDRKPQIKISAAAITWPPVPADVTEWTQSAAYTKVFQDWRGWLEEGIVDMAIPMVYIRHEGADFKQLYEKWLRFIEKSRFDRHIIVSPGVFLNKLPASIEQIRLAQEADVDGVCLYSYASYSKDGTSREAFINALTRRNGANPSPVFAKPIAVPEMPWKTRPTKGHLKGFVYGADGRTTMDGAVLLISGPIQRRLLSDATGFYGAVDLPPGEYSITASFGDQKTTATARIVVGKVNTTDIILRN